MNKILMFYLGSEWVLIQISIMHAVFMVNLHVCSICTSPHAYRVHVCKISLKHTRQLITSGMHAVKCMHSTSV